MSMDLRIAATNIGDALFNLSGFKPPRVLLEVALERDFVANGGHLPTFVECESLVLFSKGADLYKQLVMKHAYPATFELLADLQSVQLQSDEERP